MSGIGGTEDASGLSPDEETCAGSNPASRTIRKVYGPYLRKDNRQHVVIVYEDGTKRTQSYPRYLMEQNLGRELLPEETVDHIDNDFTNDAIENLQLLSLVENAKKYFTFNPAKVAHLKCLMCDKNFDREQRHETRRVKDKMNGPFCTRKCARAFQG